MEDLAKVFHIAIAEENLEGLRADLGHLLPPQWLRLLLFLEQTVARFGAMLEYRALLRLALEEVPDIADLIIDVRNAITPPEDYPLLLSRVRLELKRHRAIEYAESLRKKAEEAKDEETLNEFFEMEEEEILDVSEGIVDDFDPAQEMRTGLNALDSVWRGKPGELALFLGETGSGKSALLQNLALRYASRGYPTLLIDIELPLYVVVRRLYAMYHSVGIVSVFRQRSLQLKLDVPLKIIDAKGTLTFDRLVGSIKRVKPKVVIIDYLQLMEPLHVSSSTPDWERQMIVARTTRRIAREYDVLIVSALQTNRQGVDREMLSLKHISRSFAYATDANFIASFVRIGDTLDFRVLKSTNTEAGGTFKLGFEVSKMKIFNLASDADAGDVIKGFEG